VFFTRNDVLGLKIGARIGTPSSMGENLTECPPGGLVRDEGKGIGGLGVFRAVREFKLEGLGVFGERVGGISL